jgi:DNA-binding Lrp family transcriptional regulator
MTDQLPIDSITVPDTRISGLHRLEACKLLGWTDIPVNVTDLEGLRAELAEIDENLVRNDLTVLQQADHLARRVEVLEALGLRAKAGDNQHAAGGAPGAPPQTTAGIAAEMGISERSVQERLQIARRLTPEVKQAISRRPEIASSTKKLLQISRAEPDQQAAVLNRIEEREQGGLPLLRTLELDLRAIHTDIEVKANALVLPDGLTFDQIVEVGMALERLEPFGESMSDAARWHWGDVGVYGESRSWDDKEWMAQVKARVSGEDLFDRLQQEWVKAFKRIDPRLDPLGGHVYLPPDLTVEQLLAVRSLATRSRFSAWEMRCAVAHEMVSRSRKKPNGRGKLAEAAKQMKDSVRRLYEQARIHELFFSDPVTADTTRTLLVGMTGDFDEAEEFIAVAMKADNPNEALALFADRRSGAYDHHVDYAASGQAPA